MITEPAKTFSRVFRGYDPAAVDAFIEVLLAKQKLLIDEVQNQRTRRNECGDEAAALRIEVACLKDEVAVLSDISPSPYAMQHWMAKMMRRAVDETSRMQAEARAEAEALIALAEAEAETARRERREMLEDMAAQRKALETECQETRNKLDAELARMRAEAQSEIDEAWQDAKHERDQLLTDAQEQARRAVDEASQQRIMILEELTGVRRDLEGVPAAYQERKNPPEGSVVVPLRPENQQEVSPR
ncbi:DivIVA domain-containing protein [Mycobacterium sp. E2733]|uniref:DivIVA domain-containing protein n=1 Tax=Mycobacterium sp. E2733 TaxID=1834138 RepID=UPI0007FF90C9|nr:DivIVA domain-containing protein [Mycobacterium sp. E2733]OBI00515.1 cell division protein DivIVA [Mycobacterium sp. E2733]